MRYGLPYKGSKNQIAEKIIKYLPNGKRLVDLFGGGGAISHCASLSYKWESVLYNELNPLVCKGFRMAINGEFKNEKRWISHEEFMRLRDTDPYVAICFSFSNDLRSYAYSKDVEPFKEALHYQKVFNDKSLMWRFRGNRDGRLQNLDSLMRCESLARLQNIKEIEGTDIDITNQSYLSYEYQPGDVVYCDPPYEDTWCGGYSGFDNEEFYKWVETRDYPVFFSTYESDKLNSRFIKCWEEDKKVIAGADNSLTKRECIYTNKEPERKSLIPIQLTLF